MHLEHIPSVVTRADGIVGQLPPQDGRVITVVQPINGILPQHKCPDEVLECFLRPIIFTMLRAKNHSSYYRGAPVDESVGVAIQRQAARKGYGGSELAYQVSMELYSRVMSLLNL